MNQSKYSVIKLSSVNANSVMSAGSSGDDEYIDVEGLDWSDSLDDYVMEIDTELLSPVIDTASIEPAVKPIVIDPIVIEPVQDKSKLKKKRKTVTKNLQMFLDRKSAVSALKNPRRARNSLDGIPGLSGMLRRAEGGSKLKNK